MPVHPYAHIDAQLRAAEQLLSGYAGLQPFPFYLKDFFRENRRFGSRDRRQVSAFCYAFFRLGRALPALPLRERILAGFLLCAEDAAAVFERLRPEWSAGAAGGPEARMALLREAHPAFSLEDVFPFVELLSRGVDPEPFVASHFVQPDLFIRIRPGKRERVLQCLGEAGIEYRVVGQDTLAFGNATNLDCLGAPDRDYVIQDISSQGTASIFPATLPGNPLVWDACAGSGGKSIMAKDHFGDIRLYVTDIRASILVNLAHRFERAGIRAERMQEMDLSKPAGSAVKAFAGKGGADCIIADVPCSGSGTWGREPWMLSGFTRAGMEEYAARQKAIVSNLVPMVRPGGYLVYITCSAYAMENESIVDHLLSAYAFTCEEQRIFEGFRQRGDTMFAARLRRQA
jgi:16S rRNA (cytosine967-C5)-methyltransferase